MTDSTPRRRHRSRTEADRLAAEYEASGTSRQDFCKQQGLTIKALDRYVAKYRKRATAPQSPQQFLAVEVAASGSGGLAVVLATGRRIEVKRGFDVATLRQLVAILEQD